MYTHTTAGKPVDHAEHVWEEWNAYLAAELPEGVSRNDTGLCCHTCETIVVDRPTGFYCSHCGHLIPVELEENGWIECPECAFDLDVLTLSVTL